MFWNLRIFVSYWINFMCNILHIYILKIISGIFSFFLRIVWIFWERKWEFNGRSKWVIVRNGGCIVVITIGFKRKRMFKKEQERLVAPREREREREMKENEGKEGAENEREIEWSQVRKDEKGEKKKVSRRDKKWYEKEVKWKKSRWTLK